MVGLTSLFEGGSLHRWKKTSTLGLEIIEFDTDRSNCLLNVDKGGNWLQTPTSLLRTCQAAHGNGLILKSEQ